jgi:hypothetical protein
MFRRSTRAIDHLSPALEFVVLQTGAKMYGCHLLENHPTDYIHVPLKESHPRIKSPYAEALFYHPQLDWITSYAKDKSWNWCDRTSTRLRLRWRYSCLCGLKLRGARGVGQALNTSDRLMHEASTEARTCSSRSWCLFLV